MLIPGINQTIWEKIKWAERIYKEFGDELLSDSLIAGYLDDYRRTIQETWDEMTSVGVTSECTDCAVNDGGSCCGEGIENRFDGVLLLINLLMGARLPRERVDPYSCLFLGKKGCTIPARHTMCINYICKRLKKNIGEGRLRGLSEKILEESDASFYLEEAIKNWLLKRT